MRFNDFELRSSDFELKSRSWNFLISKKRVVTGSRRYANVPYSSVLGVYLFPYSETNFIQVHRDETFTPDKRTKRYRCLRILLNIFGNIFLNIWLESGNFFESIENLSNIFPVIPGLFRHSDFSDTGLFRQSDFSDREYSDTGLFRQSKFEWFYNYMDYKNQMEKII